MAGVEVIGGDPVEPCCKVAFRLRKQTPDHRFQLLVFSAIFGGDDNPELVAIVCTALKKRLAVGTIVISRIERAPLASAGGAVALQVAKMRSRSPGALASHICDPSV